MWGMGNFLSRKSYIWRVADYRDNLISMTEDLGRVKRHRSRPMNKLEAIVSNPFP